MRHGFLSFMLHHGISVVLLVLFVAIVHMTRSIEIENRIPVEIIHEHDGKFYCYLSRSDGEGFAAKTLSVSIGEDVTMELRVLDVSQEGRYVVYSVDVVTARECLLQNRKVTAYIKNGKSKVFDLVFQKWIRQY